jgi:hypothetical protein
MSRPRCLAAGGIEPSDAMLQTEVPPPESIDDPPIGVEAAARLMAGVGFVAFRSAAWPGSTADSCLMVAIHDAPTRRHFDAERIDYWTTSSGRGRPVELDRCSAVPFVRDFSWGQIRLVDRFGAHNTFAAFGGELSGESVGDGARLFIFRSSAPILRLGGHSQRPDRLATDVVSFFAQLVPHVWAGQNERLVAASPSLDLYAAFLLHMNARITRSAALRESGAADARVLARELAALSPWQVERGRALLERLGMWTPRH